MFVSIAICTWNRSALLRQTLDEFTRLHIPDGVAWELIVVNNNCTDDTSRVVASFAARLPIREVFERKLGQSHARNRAVQAAQGEYLLWTDDDVLVRSDWLAAYVQAIRCWPEAVYFGGPIEPLFAIEPPRWIRRHFDLLHGTYAVRDFGPVTRPLKVGETPFGANMLFRTDVIRALPFDGELGRAGHSHIRGDETELFRELQNAGRPGIWVGTARVKHYIPAERLTFGYIWKFFKGGGQTFVRHKDNPPWRSWWGIPRWAVRQCLTGAARLLLLAPFRSRAWVAAVRDTAKSLGTIQESRVRYVRQRRQAASEPSARCEVTVRGQEG
jgi:glycosyltransferase involved in cell wall biosynthesis